jgi:putative FmdB family regulatory protein
MPVYTYRREDGTTFDCKQKFLDDPLTVCPTTGQTVVRVVQPAGIIFKGSGFYVNDSKSASKKNLSSPAHSSNGSSENGSSNGESGSSKTEKSDSKVTKSEAPSQAHAAD